MQTNNITFEKFSRSQKTLLATDNTRQCKKSIKLTRKLARKQKRYDFEGAL